MREELIDKTQILMSNFKMTVHVFDDGYVRRSIVQSLRPPPQVGFEMTLGQRDAVHNLGLHV